MDQRVSQPETTAPAVHPLLVSSIVASAFFMETFDMTVIVTAFPRMAESFDVTSVSLGLGLTAYILALAVVMPASGWVADRFGAKKVFLLAIVAFVATSMLCGLSRGLPEFVAMRALQGVAAA